MQQTVALRTQDPGHVRINGEAVGGAVDGRVDERGQIVPGDVAVAGGGMGQATGHAGDGDGQRAGLGEVGKGAIRPVINLRQRRCRRRIAEIQKKGALFLGQPDCPEAAAAQAGVLRLGDGEHEGDGNGGIHRKSEQFHLRVPFLGKEINSRKGVAAISWLSKRPIIPVISHYVPGELRPKVHFLDRIDPLQWAGNPKDFIPETTRSLYGILEHYLVQYYDQWETWLYLHKYLPEDQKVCERQIPAPASGPEALRFSFNANEFELFKMDEADHYLFDKRSYATYPIGEDLFYGLHEVRDLDWAAMQTAGFKWPFTLQLIEKGILLTY